MKYIKYFENKKMDFWKINTSEPDFSISLDKLDADSLHNDINCTKIKKHDTVYVTYHISPGREIGRWVWSDSAFDIDNYNRFNYMGELELTPEDIERWEFKQHTKKYNL